MAGTRVIINIDAEDVAAIREVRKLRDEFKKTADNSAEIGKGLSSATREIGSMVAGFVSVQAAIGALTGAYREMMQTQRQAADEAIAGASSMARAYTIATSPEGRDELKGTAEYLRTQYGMDFAQAYDTAFSLGSRGSLDRETADVFGKLASAGYDVSQVVGGVSAIQGSLAGAGSDTQVLNRLFRGARENTFFTPMDLLRVSEQAAPGAAQVGTGVDEMLAIAGGIQRYRSPEELGTRLRAFATYAAERGHEGGLLSLAAQMDREFAGLGPEALVGEVPNVRAREGYLAIRDYRPQIESLRGELAAAGAPGAQDYIEDWDEIAQGDPRLAVARLTASVGARQQQVEEGPGLREKMRDAALKIRMAEMRRHGYGFSARLFEQAAGAMYPTDLLDTDPRSMLPNPDRPTPLGLWDHTYSWKPSQEYRDDYGRFVQVLEQIERNTAAQATRPRPTTVHREPGE